MTEGFERYPERGKRPYPVVRAMLVGIGVLAMGASAVVATVSEGELLKAVVVGWFALTLGLGGVGIGLMGRKPRARFRFLNAVVMTRAERAPVDSWVHVAPTKALPVPLILCNMLFTLGLVGVIVAAFLQLFGLMPRLNENAGPVAFIIAILVCLELGALRGALAYLNVARKWRNGRFGACPSGVALGEHTVSIRMPGRDGEIAWQHIRRVTSSAMTSGVVTSMPPTP